MSTFAETREEIDWAAREIEMSDGGGGGFDDNGRSYGGDGGNEGSDDDDISVTYSGLSAELLGGMAGSVTGVATGILIARYARNREAFAGRRLVKAGMGAVAFAGTMLAMSAMGASVGRRTQKTLLSGSD